VSATAAVRPFSTDSPWNRRLTPPPPTRALIDSSAWPSSDWGLPSSCVFPSQVTITTGAYPFAHRVFLFTYRQAVARPEVKAFLDFTLAHARATSVAKRLVPITDQQLSDELTLVDGHRPALPAVRLRLRLRPRPAHGERSDRLERERRIRCERRLEHLFGERRQGPHHGGPGRWSGRRLSRAHRHPRDPRRVGPSKPILRGSSGTAGGG